MEHDDLMYLKINFELIGDRFLPYDILRVLTLTKLYYNNTLELSMNYICLHWLQKCMFYFVHSVVEMITVFISEKYMHLERALLWNTLCVTCYFPEMKVMHPVTNW